MRERGAYMIGDTADQELFEHYGRASALSCTSTKPRGHATHLPRIRTKLAHRRHVSGAARCIDRPSIAVFAVSEHKGIRQDCLADGLTEDIITGLSRQRWFLCCRPQCQFAGGGDDVAAEASWARYVEGWCPAPKWR
jgi:hypothetical protein